MPCRKSPHPRRPNRNTATDLNEPAGPRSDLPPSPADAIDSLITANFAQSCQFVDSPQPVGSHLRQHPVAARGIKTRLWTLVPALALLAATVAASPAATVESTATVQRIHDGKAIAIDGCPERVGGRARSPQQMSTGDSRACTRSNRLSVGGGNDVFVVLTSGELEISVLERLVLVESLGEALRSLAKASAPAPDPMLGLINGARAGQGRAPLQPLPATLASSNRAYAEPVLHQMIASGSCDHDLDAWQAFQARTARGPLQPVSEVLGCPVPSGRWNPERLLSLWLGSPHHNDILLNRPRASHAACIQLSEAGRTGVLCSFWAPAVGP